MTIYWPWLGVFVLVFGPAVALWWLGARLRWMFIGIGSWFLALFLKILAIVALYGLDGESPLPILSTAALHGLISVLAELGLAALFLRGQRLRLVDAIAFGAGIGAFEVAWVLWEGSLELIDVGELTWDNFLAFANGLFLIERTITLIGHTASRVLIYAALVRRQALPAVVAVMLFWLCDGAAVYGGLAGWQWDDPWILVGFDSFLAIVGIIEAAAAWYFSQEVSPKVPSASLNRG
jgi:hypothetical protein